MFQKINSAFGADKIVVRGFNLSGLEIEKPVFLQGIQNGSKLLYCLFLYTFANMHVHLF